MFTLFFYILIFSVLVIVAVLAKKIPQLRVIDVSSIPKEKIRQIKERLIVDKIQRKGGGLFRGIGKVSSVGVRSASKFGRRAVQRLYRLEQYYQKMKTVAEDGSHGYDTETIKKKIYEAEELIKKEEFIPAEKLYIDVISHNPKCVSAYEGLGNLYRKNKQYAQARETLEFTLKLSPNDASVLVTLAELEVDLENHRAGFEYLKKAVAKRSKNPKYLDFYIDTALHLGSLKDARKGIGLLKAVNPENKKLVDFENRFQKLKDEYIAKTKTD